MDRDRFLTIVEAYGADPRRWPATERATAQAFAAADPQAPAILAAADALDAWLHESAVAAPSEDLRRRVLEAAPRPRRKVAARQWWAPGAGFAAAGLAGIVLGLALFGRSPPAAPEPEQGVAAVMAEAEPFDEAAILTFGGEAQL